MNVDELSGDDLNRAVAKCYGMHVSMARGGWFVFDSDAYSEFCNEYNDDKLQSFRPSTNWAQGGAIIQREKIGIWWATHFVDDEGNEYGNHWYAEIGCTDANADSPYCGVATGATPLIAAMRCYVASKQGEQSWKHVQSYA